MNWRAPDLLWLLLLIPAVAVLLGGLALWRKRATARFGAGATALQLVRGRSTALRWVRGGVLLAGLTVLVLALAGPRYGSRTRMVRKTGIDVVIALDFSKSMLARDVKPSRVQRAKAEIMSFVRELGGDRVGLVAFAGETMEFPLTVDYGALSLFFRDLGPNDMPVGGTAIGRALVAARRMVARANGASDASAEGGTRGARTPERAAVVVLLTDGEDHEGDPIKAAEELKAAGIPLYVVGIGSRKGEPIPTYAQDGTWTGYLRDNTGKAVTSALSAENEAELQRLADITGGRYFRAGRGGVGMQQVRTAMRQMKQQELKARQVTVHEERYALFLWVAFMLILLEALLPEAWFARSEKKHGAGTTPAAGAAALLVALALTPAARARAWDPFTRLNPEVQQGNQLMTQDKSEAALKRYDLAARALPGRAEVQLNRGIALLAAGRNEEARQALLLATQPNPEDTPGANKQQQARVQADAYYNMGLSFYRDGDKAAAAEEPDKAQQMFREAADAFRRSLRARPAQKNPAWNLELALQREREEDEKAQKQDQQDQKQDQQDQKQDQQDQKQDQQDQQDQKQDQQDQKQDQKQDQQDQKQDQQDQKQDQQDQKQDQKQDQQQDQQDQQDQQPKERPSQLTPEAQNVLDSLRDSEQNFERHRARTRALRSRKPAKDW